MQQEVPLARGTRRMIVLIALLQGLALYAMQELAERWQVRDGVWRYCAYAWLLTIPTALALTVVEVKDRRLWQHAGLASLLVLGLGAWAAWNLQGASGLNPTPVLMPLSVCLGISVFIALPWWQFRLQQGHWNASYTALFEHAWQNGLTLALAGAFTGLTWALLWLCAALFSLLRVDFFQQLFLHPAFVALATGLLAGFGLLIGRTQHRAIQITRQVLFAVCRGLLPLLALIALLFVSALPFTGLAPLWGTHSAASLLLAMALLLVAFANAVYQHDSDTAVYPRGVRRLVDAGLLTLPVYAALALFAIGLRLGQHGMTVDRFWGLATALLVAGYALGYALAVLRRQGRWLQGLEAVNRWMCGLVLAMAILGSSPLIDPIRLTLASQVPRFTAQPDQITGGDASMLRFELGIRGVRALNNLQQQPGVIADPHARSVLAEALPRPTGGHDVPAPSAPRSLDQLHARIIVAKGSPMPADDWWQALLHARRIGADGCLDIDEECIAVRRDLDQDGEDEVLLCRISPYLPPDCTLHVRHEGAWHSAGSVSFPRHSSAQAQTLTRALRGGGLETRPSRWPEMRLEGIPAQLSLDEDEGREEAAAP